MVLPRLSVCLLFFMWSVVLSSQTLPCECDTDCPDPINFNGCGSYQYPASLWQNNGTTLREIVNVDLTGIPNEIAGIEVEYCCRVRLGCPSLYSDPFGTDPIDVSCEMVIKCIKIPKELLMGFITLGEPPPFWISQELVRKTIEKMICANPCNMGFPAAVGGKPYEWVITVPNCFVWNKEANSHYCLEACSDKYCVTALMIGNEGNEPILIQQKRTTWLDDREDNTEEQCYHPCRIFECTEYNLECLE